MLAGAFVVAAIVWQFGNVIGSRTASPAPPAGAPAAVERPANGSDDAGEVILAPGGVDGGPGGGGAAATSGTANVEGGAAPPASPVIAAAAGEPLADRDLVMPVEGVEPDDLVRSFSDSRGGRPHEAIDIPAPRNTPVKAIEAGKIARLFYSRAGGVTIYQFDPTETYCYYYAHLERYADGLAEGQEVRKGQLVGYVGVSGNAPKATPHLHFAIFRLTAAKRWWEGTPLDPYDVLR
jgi:murein DD-endopeptidase MepM/ murein hydrolase activator NlpD